MKKIYTVEEKVEWTGEKFKTSYRVLFEDGSWKAYNCGRFELPRYVEKFLSDALVDFKASSMGRSFTAYVMEEADNE